jgi:SAM-dependent methyltransferase
VAHTGPVNSTSGVLWEEISCPICPPGTASESNLMCGDRLATPALHNYRLVKCSGCGLIYLSPRPVLALAAEFHLQTGYDPFVSFAGKQSLFDKLYLRAREWTSSWKMKLISEFVPAGSQVLDIGCGTGEFLAAIKHRFQVTGVEPEAAAAEWGSKNHAITIHSGYLDQIDLQENHYDLVTMWHALEHIPDPVGALKHIHRLLKSDGKLLIALPNIGSYDAKLYGAGWIALDAPRHLWHFTPDTLAHMAGQCGFSPVRGGALPLDLYYNILQSEGILRASGSGSLLTMPIRIAKAWAGSLAHSVTKQSPSGFFRIFQA